MSFSKHDVELRYIYMKTNGRLATLWKDVVIEEIVLPEIDVSFMYKHRHQQQQQQQPSCRLSKLVTTVTRIVPHLHLNLPLHISVVVRKISGCVCTVALCIQIVREKAEPRF